MSEPADPVAEGWEARFRAPRVGLPDWARDRPERTLLRSNETGTWEVSTWRADTGERRQVTSRANGTSSATVSPDGSTVWWFDDTDGDEFGVWRRQPYDGGPDEPAATNLEPGYQAGLALGLGVAVVGRSTDDGSSLHVVTPGEPSRVLYASPEDASVVDLDRDEQLVCLEHSEHGDSRHPALRVVRLTDGSTVADLWDGPGKGLSGVGFAPAAGDGRVLVVHERRGRPELLLWDAGAGGAVTELALDLPGEVGADWYPDGNALLVSHDHRGRSELYRYDLPRHDLGEGRLEPLGTPPGVVGAATARPDGDVWYSGSSGVAAPAVRDLTGAVVVAPDAPPPPPGVAAEDVDVETPHGTVHALLSRPAGLAPHAAVFVAHGGPTWHDEDSYAPDVAALTDAGYAVVRVNYRGSTGYGSAWRDALEAAPGRTELTDIAAVRAHLVEAGVLDGGRVALSGGSWGGYLTLLGLGTQPDLWAAGSAAVPVADYVAAYEDEMEGLKAFDRSLFGGSPTEVPERYRVASPLTYVEQVRAPVLVLAGANDPRCPIRQIDNYLARLAELGREHEVYRFDAGHGSLVVEERVRQMRVELDFLLRHVPPTA